MGLRHLLDRLAVAGVDLRPVLRRLRRRGAPVPGLVSIILPTRNRAATIARAINSVLAQTYLNWELIIIDDGGTDATPAIIRRYRAERRLRYHRRAAARVSARVSIGVSAARNAGLAQARGDIIAYIDSDNRWDPSYLAAMVAALAGPAVDCAYAMLVRDEAGAAPDVLFTPFDRAALLRANFIDLNVFAHRHAMFAKFGGFDTALKRLVDWDLILRYTAHAPALAVAVPGAHYHTDATARITEQELFSPAYRHIRAKWRIFSRPARPVRVLYALWQYPQLSESYIETEIIGLRRLGVVTEIWSECTPCAPYPAAGTIHRGSFADAVAAFRPDVVHVHWLNTAIAIAEQATAHGLKVTVRGHSFDMNEGYLHHLLAHPAVARVYLYDHQIETFGVAGVTRLDNAFNTDLFRPAPKDRRLVLRASAGLPAKDLPFFLQLARLLPAHRFILCVSRCSLLEAGVDALLALARTSGSPAEIRIDVPHDEVAALMAQAGIYLHTVTPPEQPGGTPLGAPSSILEALASGCYVLCRDLPPLAGLLGEAGATYADAAAAAALIEATASWDDAQWRQAGLAATERAWTSFAGDDDFHILHEDWVNISGL